MTQWTNRPPATHDGHALAIARTPATGTLTLIVTSPDLIGCRTHFYKGRTTPCTETKCHACNEGMPWRWHAYLGAADPKTGRHVLIELTATGCQPLAQYHELTGTLRGATIALSRPSGKYNGRVVARVSPIAISPMQLPPPPDVPHALAIIWNVPYSSIAPGPTNAETRIASIDGNQVEAAQRHPAEPPISAERKRERIAAAARELADHNARIHDATNTTGGNGSATRP